MSIARILLALGLSIGALACAAARHGVASTFGLMVLFEEDFSTLDSGWTWIREEPSGWKIADGALLIRSDPGALAGDENNNRNLLTRPAPDDSDFLAEVTVLFQPVAMYEQAGLILYLSDDDFVKLQVELTEAGSEVTFTRETRGTFDIIASVRAPRGATQLRLGRYGEQARAFVWEPADGAWLLLGEVEAPGPAPRLRVGLAGGFGVDEAGRWAEYRDFRLLTLEAGLAK